MTDSRKPFVIVFLGSIGVGKSYFAKQLSEKLRIIRLNSDAMREAMGDEWSEQTNHRLFGAMDYAIGQILQSGKSVIYDAARMNKLDARETLRQIAHRADADMLIVWVETSREVVEQRVTTRQPTSEHLQFSTEEAKSILQRHDKSFSPPQSNEQFVRIDGTASFEDQYTSFVQQLEGLDISI